MCTDRHTSLEVTLPSPCLCDVCSWEGWSKESLLCSFIHPTSEHCFVLCCYRFQSESAVVRKNNGGLRIFMLVQRGQRFAKFPWPIQAMVFPNLKNVKKKRGSALLSYLVRVYIHQWVTCTKIRILHSVIGLFKFLMFHNKAILYHRKSLPVQTPF